MLEIVCNIDQKVMKIDTIFLFLFNIIHYIKLMKDFSNILNEKQFEE